MKCLVDISFESTRDVVHRVLRGADEDTLSAVGVFENIYRIIRNYKQNKTNPKPYLFPEARISRNLAFTYT
jgi:hypothetical protein